MKTESPAPAPLVSDERKPLSYYMNNALWYFDFGQPPDPISGQVVPRSTVESWLDRTKEMEAALAKMRAERDELVGALQSLVSEASRHQLCDILSHPLKSDRHKYGETCPPLERIESLLSKHTTE